MCWPSSDVHLLSIKAKVLSYFNCDATVKDIPALAHDDDHPHTDDEKDEDENDGPLTYDDDDPLTDKDNMMILLLSRMMRMMLINVTHYCYCLNNRSFAHITLGFGLRC